MSVNPVCRLVVKIVVFITANIFMNRVVVQLQRYVGKHVLFCALIAVTLSRYM